MAQRKLRQRIITSTIEFHGECSPRLFEEMATFVTKDRRFKEWNDPHDEDKTSRDASVFLRFQSKGRHWEQVRLLDKQYVPEVLADFKRLASGIQSTNPEEDTSTNVPLDGSFICGENGNGGP